MATVRPFRGLRPIPELAAAVASRPYDVLNAEEARSEASGNPHSFLHITRPEIDFTPGDPVPPEDIYARGRANLVGLVDRGVLMQDGEPHFYLYAQTMGTHRQTGIVGCVAVREYLSGILKRHELTRPDKEDDRTRHILATRSHSGMVFICYRAIPGIDSIVREAAAGRPVYDFVADDGVRHQFWIVASGGAGEQLAEAFSRVTDLYIADGHHRSAAAVRAAEECARRNPHHTGEAEYNFFPALLVPHDQVHILEYNRLLKDLNGLSPARLIGRLQKTFSVMRTSGQVRPTQKGQFGLYLEGGWYLLSVRDRDEGADNPVERLDVTLLQRRILGPILGIDDPRTSPRIDFVGGIRGLGELEQRVNSGEMAAAFALHPTSIGELLAIADAGQFMPPKSTWFEPKPRDGLVVHMLD